MTVRAGINDFGSTGRDNRLLNLTNLLGITEHVATRR